MWYGKAIEGLFSATTARRVNWVGDTITVSLHTSAYTPDQDTHDFFNDATNELSGNNYARQTLSGKQVGPLDPATNLVALLASNTTFTNLGSPSSVAFRYAVIWVETAGASSTDPLLGYVDLGAQSVNVTDFVIDWSDVGGVLQAVYS